MVEPMTVIMKLKNPIFGKICFFLLALFLVGCAERKAVINSVDERDANEMIVFLASKGVLAEKIKAEAQEGAGGTPVTLWNIMVPPTQTVQAMSLLNQVGLPRKKGPSLLDLFAAKGLMTSDRQETIRYQAGLEEELTNVIRKIDGVLDAKVQISFPSSEELSPGMEKKKIKAAVYVKHQGVFEDPNNHLETKVKRLVAGSVDGLDFENVSVISDRARFSELMGPKEKDGFLKCRSKDMVSIWSIVMSKASAGKFRTIFFLCLGVITIFGISLVLLVYKYYPVILQDKGKKEEEPVEKIE